MWLCVLAVCTTSTGEDVQLATVHLMCNQCAVQLLKTPLLQQSGPFIIVEVSPPHDTQVQGLNPEVNKRFGPGGSISSMFPNHSQETEAGRVTPGSQYSI
ncbi:hypothetical protein XENORESO_012605 [Xenotaenia resolanae]|uniref:Uncharacterized protein n=1 Tax=Xenotaenia resolanae TaxID=208358 RepID=A0ABV0X2C1_9TELE